MKRNWLSQVSCTRKAEPSVCGRPKTQLGPMLWESSSSTNEGLVQHSIHRYDVALYGASS